MYWDVKGLSEQRAAQLTDFLHCPLSTGPDNGGFIPTSARSSGSGLSAPPAAHMALRQRSRYVPPGRIDPLICNATSTDNAFIQRNVNPRFLELCVNTGSYSKTLGEIDITHINSDGELFDSILRMYREKRCRYGLIHFSVPKCFGDRWRYAKFTLQLQKPSSVVLLKVRRSRSC